MSKFALITVIAGTLLVGSGHGLRAFDIDRPPIEYSTADTDNVVSQLQSRLTGKMLRLKHDNEHGYLKSLLEQLQIPESSQVLVFSKTSLQRSRITPKTPRAIYFNDDVTVGFCQRGDVLELAAADPNLGTVFYTLDQDPHKPVEFSRRTGNCLVCHASSRNQGFPGHIFRSVTTDRTGELILSRGTKRIDHTTPFADRWGGWYVTGQSGSQEHLGNQIQGGWPGLAGNQVGHNVTDLKPFFTASNYLTEHSDLVALMVLEHQGEAHNRIARANFLTRMALHEQAELNKAFGEPAGTRSEGITRRIESACEQVVQYLLFAGEAELTEPISGTTDFAKEFEQRGPFDRRERSLRQFDLNSRLFRYPMSYTIYSKLFDGLPEEAKARIYLRLWQVLTGKDRSKEFAHLSDADRQAILEMLRETKADLPDYWHN